MKRFVAKKYIVFYLLIFFLFKFAFSHFINPYYIQDRCVTPYPIDVRVAETHKWSDTGYLVTAKKVGYNHLRYYQSFLPVDLIFPIFYTLLFLTSLKYCANPTLKKILVILVMAGGLADWSEDISFASFLGIADNGLASIVAFFTSVKTVLIFLNIIICILFLVKALRIWLEDATPGPET